MHDYKPTAVIFDLDGFLVDSTKRIARTVNLKALKDNDIQGYLASYDAYSQDTEGDVAIPGGMELASALVGCYQPELIIYLTARGEEGRAPTEAWLRRHKHARLDHYPQKLIMQAARLRDADGNIVTTELDNAVEYKRKQLRLIRDEYRVLVAVDDHTRISEMYAEEGVFAIQVYFPGISVFGGGALGALSAGDHRAACL